MTREKEPKVAAWLAKEITVLFYISVPIFVKEAHVFRNSMSQSDTP